MNLLLSRILEPQAFCPSRKRVWLVMCCWGILCASALAQTDKWVEKGELELSQGSYLKAIEYFEWSLRQDTSLNAAKGLAMAYQGLSDFKRSLEWWSISAHRPDATPVMAFYYGRALLSQDQLDSAAVWFRRYHELAPDDPHAARYKDVQAWLPEMFKDSALYKVERMKLNSKNDDFGAAWFEKGILFCSNRPADIGVVHSSVADGLPMIDLYYAEWDSAKGWRKPTSFDAVNTRYHEGPVCVDTARKQLYVTRNAKAQSAGVFDRDVRQLSIVVYQSQNGRWIPGAPLPLSEGHAYAHPALSPDGQRLYFCADLPEGRGGTDIWYLEANGEGWSAPINAGNKVNTPGNESYPAFQRDGTLFFTSDGHPGLGGLDIFFCRPDAQGAWNSPLNPGVPINSPKDDFAMQPKGEGEEGIFSSNRAGTMRDDLWFYQRSRPDFECQPQTRNNYCFKFWETGSIETDTVPLVYVWDMGDGNFRRGLQVQHCFPGPGDYLVQLNLIDSISGWVFLNEATYEMKIRDAVQAYIEVTDTISLGQATTFDASKSKLADCQPNKYFWDFGDGSTAKGLNAGHVYIQSGEYEVSLGITGDVPGSSQPCRSCVTRKVVVMTQQRIQAVEDSLRKVQEENLFNVPTGELMDAREIDDFGKEILDIRDSSNIRFRVQIAESTEPLSLNKAPLNQFPDPKAIKEYKVGSIYKYMYGDEKTRSSIYPLFEEAHAKGFEDALVVAFKGDRAISGNDSTFSIRIPVRLEGDRVTIFSGVVKDAQGNPLTAEISVEDLLKKVQVVRVKTDSTGAFRLRLPDGSLYGYFIETQGYFPFSDYIDLRNPNNINKSEVVVRQNVTMQSIQEIVKTGTAVRINNIFFDYNDATIRKESLPELKRLSTMLRNNPKIDVEILGHTDSDGEDTYNLELSKRRADAVAAVLSQEGMGKRIVRTIGYGELQPLTPNDTPEGKQLNRRVEFRLLER